MNAAIAWHSRSLEAVWASTVERAIEVEPIKAGENAETNSLHQQFTVDCSGKYSLFINYCFLIQDMVLGMYWNGLINLEMSYDILNGTLGRPLSSPLHAPFALLCSGYFGFRCTHCYAASGSVLALSLCLARNGFFSRVARSIRLRSASSSFYWVNYEHRPLYRSQRWNAPTRPQFTEGCAFYGKRGLPLSGGFSPAPKRSPLNKLSRGLLLSLPERFSPR